MRRQLKKNNTVMKTVRAMNFRTTQARVHLVFGEREAERVRYDRAEMTGLRAVEEEMTP